MVHFLPFFSQPAPHAGAPAHTTSFTNNIATIGLGALAFFSANLFDHTNPGLAAVVRCAVGGVGLVWLFNKCCPSSSSFGPHHHHPVYPEYDSAYVTPLPLHKKKKTGFWGDYSVNNMWKAPFSRFNPQNSVQQSHYAPPQKTFIHQPTKTKQAETTYSAYSSKPGTSFPNVAKVSQVAGGGFPDVFHSTQQNYSGLNPAPTTHHSHQPQLAKTAYSQQQNIMGSGGVSSNSIPTSKYTAPSKSGGFPDVNVYKSSQGSHPGNTSQMFKAAASR